MRVFTDWQPSAGSIPMLMLPVGEFTLQRTPKTKCSRPHAASSDKVSSAVSSNQSKVKQ